MSTYVVAVEAITSVESANQMLAKIMEQWQSPGNKFSDDNLAQAYAQVLKVKKSLGGSAGKVWGMSTSLQKVVAEVEAGEWFTLGAKDIVATVKSGVHESLYHVVATIMAARKANVLKLFSHKLPAKTDALDFSKWLDGKIEARSRRAPRG